MMRTLLELLSQKWSGKCENVFAYNEHDLLAVQERYHLFDQSLWRFTLSGQPRRTVLEADDKERITPPSHKHTCSTVATTGNLSRSNMSMHSCAILKCNENCERLGLVI
jgi:hypothetical protein